MLGKRALRRRSIAVVSAVLVVAGAACGRAGPSGAGGGAGRGEGLLNLVAPPGYVEDGADDARFDWVHPFEHLTGCMVTVKYAISAGEMVGLLRQSSGSVYDGAAISSDAVGRLIGHGDLTSLDPARLPGLRSLLGPLRFAPFDSANGRPYGVPFEYGPNLLLYDSSRIHPAPASWSVVWSPSPYRGRIAAFDGPMSLAEAALYLKAHRPGLRITDPYELTSAQFEAAAALIVRQNQIARRWTSFTDELTWFSQGQAVIGAGRPIVMSLTRAVPVAGVVPSEGVTGWVDSWVMSTHARHPDCMYRWMQWTMDPRVQALAAQYLSAAPANPAACPLLEQAVGFAAGTLRYGRCGDAGFYSSLALWKTPVAECGDGRSDCVPYSVWDARWRAISP